MRWFQKNTPENTPETEEESTPAQARNPDNVFLFRLLAVGYILYTVWKTISLYLEGGEDAPKLWMLCLSTVLLGGGAIVLAVISYKAWKKAKAQQLEEAEAAAEEAFLAEQEEEDA